MPWFPPGLRRRWGLRGLGLGLNGLALGGWVWLGWWAIQGLGPDSAGAIALMMAIGALGAIAALVHLLRLSPQASLPALGRALLIPWGTSVGLSLALGLGMPLALGLLLLPHYLGHSWLLLPWIAILLPSTLLAAVDWWRIPAPQRCYRHYGWLYLGYLYYFLGFGILPALGAVLGFLLVPAGLVLQVISGLDLLVALAHSSLDTAPRLCVWVNTWLTPLPFLPPLAPRFCLPLLLLLHLGHPLLLFLLCRYGAPGFDALMDGYGRGLGWLRDRLPPPPGRHP